MIETGARYTLQGWSWSRSVQLAACLLLVPLVILTPAARAQGLPVSPQPSQESHRIVVKLKTSLTGQIEAELPAQGPLSAMTIPAGGARSAALKNFFSRYSPDRLTPLYPAMIRARQQNGWSDAQMADLTRQRFPNRAVRQRNTLGVPEISRTYVLGFSGANRTQIKALIQRLGADPDVEFAEPDRIVHTTQLPNDPFLSSSGTWGQGYQDLWGHYAINAPTAWNTALGDGMIVAVVDTGIDYNHPDIAGNVIVKPGSDFIGSTCTNPTTGDDPIDHFGHGTHVAGTIAAVGNNGIGIIGIAWHSQVLAVKGLDDVGCGLESTLAPAIQFAANNGADVINASWGGEGTSQTIEQAIQFASGLGVVFVAAAGNSTEDATNFFPADSPEAITVAAFEFGGFPASFSNFGTKIDVTAPGVDILSLRAAGSNIGLIVDNDYMRLDGTSMSAPHVSGSTALILEQHPAYTTEDVRQTLRASTTASPINNSGWDPLTGYGILNASGALALTSVLQAHIASPVGGTHVNSLVTLSGVAQGPGFDHYVLDFGAGTNPTTFTTLATSTSPVNGGTLGTFDPTQVPEGAYTIRLTAFDSSNHAFVDRMVVDVNFLTITSPQTPDSPSQALEFKPGAQIQITGTANGGSFKDFRVQWAEGIEPTAGFNVTGITLAGGGASPVTGGTLATWDTSSITQADFYTIRLLVDDSSFTSTTDTLIYLEPALVSQDWPKVLNQVPNFGTGFVPFLDATGKNQLALVTPIFLFDPIPGEYLTFSPDGSSQNAIGVNEPSYYNPAAATLDQNPGQEVVVAEVNDIRIFHPDNSSTTIPLPAAFSNYFMTQDQVVLAPLEGTAQLDILDMAESVDSQNNQIGRVLFAWRPDGSLINSNFPITVPDLDQNALFPQGPRFLVGDLNGDGKQEIIVVEGVGANSFTLGLFAQDGTPLSWSVPVMDGYTASIVLADLDHNGKLETVMVQDIGDEIGGSFTSGLLHVFQPDGSERPGWPVPITVVGLGDGSVAVGDLNGDGREEIVVDGQASLFVFNTDGTPFSSAWPIVFQGCTASGCPAQILGPILLADVDGDGLPEIIVPQWNFLPNPLFPGPLNSSSKASQALQAQLQARRAAMPARRGSGPSNLSITTTSSQPNYNTITLTALRRDGAIAKSWNVQGTIGQEPGVFSVVAAVGDFEQNGTTEIALSYQTDVPGRFSFSGPVPGMVTVLSTGAPFNPNANDWPLVYQNTRNTATRQRTITLSITAPAPGVVSGIVAVTAATTGTINSLQFMLDGTNLGTALTAPPFTVQWDTSSSARGSHQLTAVATDSNRVPVASAPVNVIIGHLSNTALTTSNPSVNVNSSVTFTATVTSPDPGAPSGSVQFMDGAAVIQTSPLNGQGVATFTTSALAAGTHIITAQYTGDSTFNASSASVTENVILNPSNTALTTSNPSVTVNSSVTFTATVTSPDPGTPSGTVQFLDRAAVLQTSPLNSQGMAIFTTTALAAGTHIITAQYTGDSTFNASSASVTENVILNPSNLALTSSNPSVNVNSSVTFTATVTSPGPGTPSGTVQFLDGAAVVQISPLNGQGVAAFATSSLIGGTHTITAKYTGDSAFSGSSASVTENIMDFSATTSLTGATIQAGASANFAFTVTPVGGFNQTVSFSCTGLPAESQCSFNPSSVTPNGASVTSTMTITTTGPSAALISTPYRRNSFPLYASLSGGVLGLVWMAAGGRRRRKTKSTILLTSFALLIILGLASCGGGGSTPKPGNPGTPAGTSQITVTTTAGSTSHTSQVTITVTN